jgi:hypothetical protein
VSGSAEATGPGATAADRRRRHRGIWAGLIIGVVAAAGALVAVLQDSGGGDRDGPPAPVDGPIEATHEFPADYGGQVWITVVAPDAAPRSVSISWGPWEKRFVHESEDPQAYWFTKHEPQPGDESVPATVRVDPAAEVTFDQGTPPIGALDRSTGWDPAS